jgi:deoxycytidylate deaminase
VTDNEINKIKVYLDIAIKLSSLSKDPNTKVASIILRSDFSLVSVGYNGFPPLSRHRRVLEQPRSKEQDGNTC